MGNPAAKRSIRLLLPLVVLLTLNSTPAHAELRAFLRGLAACAHFLGFFAEPPREDTSPSGPAVEPPRESSSLRGPAVDLPELPPLLVARVRERHHGFDPRRVSAQWVTGSWFDGYDYPGLGVEKDGSLEIYYDGEMIADASMYTRKGALRFDIEVQKPYRGTQLYEYLLRAILKKCPETQTISARMPFTYSDNAQFLIKTVFGSRRKLTRTAFGRLGHDGVRSLRAKLIDTLYRVPAIKARARNGFGRITKLVINPTDASIAFIAERGPPLPADALPIYLERRQPQELMPSGQMRPVPPEALSLGSYLDFDRY
jgi:hypothetical protein